MILFLVVVLSCVGGWVVIVGVGVLVVKGATKQWERHTLQAQKEGKDMAQQKVFVNRRKKKRYQSRAGCCGGWGWVFSPVRRVRRRLSSCERKI